MLVKIHVVQQGDTLWKIAQQYGVDFEKLKQANSHLANPDQLSPGQKIKIPQGPHQAKKHQVGGGMGIKVKQVKEEPEIKPKEEAKKEEALPSVQEKEEHELLKALIKKAAPYVITKLLKDEKPEVINQIKIELDMANINQPSFKPPTPMPMPYPHHPYKPLSPHLYQPCPPHHVPPKGEEHKVKLPMSKGEECKPKGKWAPPSPPVKESWKGSMTESGAPYKKEQCQGQPPSSPYWSPCHQPSPYPPAPTYPQPYGPYYSGEKSVPRPPAPFYGKPYGPTPHGPFGHYGYPPAQPTHRPMPSPDPSCGEPPSEAEDAKD